MDARSFSQKLNSRKLALAAGVITAATALLFGGYISGDNWVNATTVVSGAYMASQAWVDRSRKNV